MIRFYIFVLLSVFLQGCHGRKRVPTVEEKVFSYPAAVVMPFAYDEGVQAEDAINFTAYFAKALTERGFQINVSEGAVADFSLVGQRGDSGLLQELAEKHAVDGIILGKLQSFSYQREGRSFVIMAEADVEVLTLHDGQQVCKTNRKLIRRFRIRNVRQTDFSVQNIEFLRQFTNILIAELLQNWLVKEKELESTPVQSSSEAVVSELKAAEQTKTPVSVLKKEPEKSSSLQDLKQRLDYLRDNLSKPIPPPKTESPSNAPRWQELQPSSEKTPLISVRRLTEKESQSSKPPIVDVASSIQKRLNLSLPGFQLVYPLEFDPEKKYEKFYYLLERGGSQIVSETTVEDSVEENLVLEIFAAVNRFAVGRFLSDYFQGVSQAPLSGIPEAFERNYLGKYQLGFMMGENAVISTGHRKYRTEILSALSQFFENNGGVSLQTVIQDVAAQAANAGRKNIDYSSKKQDTAKAFVLPKSVVTAKSPIKQSSPVLKAKSPAQTAQAPVLKAKPPAQTAQTPTLKTKPSVKTAQSSVVKPPPSLSPKSVASNLKSVEQKSLAPTQAKAPAQTSTPQFTVSQPAISAAPAISVAPAQLQESASQPNPRFFYNLGERYFHLQDYENAARFFADARKNGFRSPELQAFEQQLTIILGNEPVVTGDSELASSVTRDLSPISESVVSPVMTTVLRPVVQTTAAPVLLTTRASVAFEYEQDHLDDVEEQKPAAASSSVLPREPASGLMDDFYREMDKIEAELEKIKKTRQGLSTKAAAYDISDISMLILKILLLLGTCLAIFSFLSTKNIK